MRRHAGLGLWLLILAGAVGAVWWNGSRFVGTRQRPLTKDLSFLPPPVVAQALSLGQGTAVAKLRWIDSFAYFEYQIERKDDHVAGADGRGAFVRLYETLIALDPRFVPFYEHAILNTSGILTDYRSGLAFALRGTLELPQESSLWRSAAASLAVHFQWTKRNPAALDAFLRSWSECESGEEGRQRVQEWRRGLAFQHIDGLETLPWWLGQVRSAKPGTALGDYIEGTVRELLANHAVRTLPGLLAPSPDGPAAPPRFDPGLVAARFPHGIPSWEAIGIGPGGLALRSDPFGWPFRLEGGKLISPGLEQRRFLARTLLLRNAIASEGGKRGRPPRDAREAAEWGGGELPSPPEGGSWSFRDGTAVVTWPAPPGAPWTWR